MKEKIIQFSEEKFFREGFQKVTMNEIATDLRISKKTIYKYFPSKEDLVIAVTKQFMSHIKAALLPILGSDKNAIEKLEGLITTLTTVSQKISTKMIDDMRRYFPERWKEIDKFRTEMMFGNLTKVINQGKKEGLFIDYPTQIIITAFVAAMRSVVNPDFILNNNFSVKEAATTAFNIIISGIVTEKGKKLLKKRF